MRTMDNTVVGERYAKVTTYSAGVGTAVVLDDGNPTGETIEFRFDDGQFIWTDGDTTEWDGVWLHHMTRLDEPGENSLIVFTMDDQGRVTWTHEALYHDCLIYQDSVQFRVVNDQGTVLWLGLYSRKYDDIAIRDGQQPRQLEEGMIVQIGDNPYGNNPYGDDIVWEAAHDQEALWMSLCGAAKRL